MIKFQLWLRRVFGISKSESTGLIIFLPLVLFLIFLPSFVKQLIQEEIDFEKEEERLNILIAQLEIDTESDQVEKPQYQLFDPNNISEDELVLMGVDKVVASNWERYLTHGGRFKSVDDIMKIYGLSPETFRNIKPYINIEASVDKYEKRVYENKHQSPVVVSETVREKRIIKPFDLNKADTATLKRLRGIGSVLSKRIVKYRESLGGFTSKAQLKEVWGLSDTVLTQLDSMVYLEKHSPDIRLLQINEATERQLARHPYLSNKQASAIVAYRYQHGKFHQISDLYNVHRLDSLVIAKISSYLEF